MTYTVKYGDTLSQIAYTYGTTVEDIANENGIENVDVIEVGQILSIPDTATKVSAASVPASVSVSAPSLFSGLSMNMLLGLGIAGGVLILYLITRKR